MRTGEGEDAGPAPNKPWNSGRAKGVVQYRLDRSYTIDESFALEAW